MARLDVRRGGGPARLLMTDPKTGELLLSVSIGQCRFVELADPRW
jgi:hypothetical protein